MPVNLLRDADIQAISIVKEGANRKRYFLFKSKADPDEETTQLGSGRLLKAADYETVYAVVAEPGAHENPGQGAPDPDIDDRWADEDEIRKAAHRFMSNGGLVTKMHESMEPYGRLVENAIALADFEVGGETIRKGSWYIAFQPTDEGKEAIDKGEFSGVSIEGQAVRELVEKGEDGDPEKAKGSTVPAPTVGPVEKGLLRKMAEKVGLTSEEIAEVEKAEQPKLPDALGSLSTAVTKALLPDEGEPDTEAVTKACEEFTSWVKDAAESAPVEKSERAEALGVKLDSEGSTLPTGTKDGEMALTDQERQEFDSLKKKVEEFDADKIAGAFASQLAKALGVKDEDDEPTPESIAKRIEALGEKKDDDLAKEVASLKTDIAKLAEGDSNQPSSADEPSDEDKAELAKSAYKDRGLDPALAGMWGDI